MPELCDAVEMQRTPRACRLTPGSVAPVTSKGTTRRSIRVPDELWDPALELAKRNGGDLSAVIREALADYLDKHKEKS